MKKAIGFVWGVLFVIWTITVMTLSVNAGKSQGLKDARKMLDSAMDELRKKYNVSSEEKKEEAGA